MEQRDREKKEAEGMLGSDAAAGDAKAETGTGNKENDTDKYLN